MGDSLSVVNAVVGTVNLLTLLAIAFHGGRWMGRIEARLNHLEHHQERRLRK